MAKREIERTVQPSIIDRLTDENPRTSAEAKPRYAESLRQYKLSVQRDLEWLLNTRRTPELPPDDLPELNRSLYTYGIPDITSYSRDSLAARKRLLRHVEESLRLFEPRLTNVRISLVDQEGEEKRRELRFVVEATLQLDPSPEQVTFDTVLQFSSGQYDVAASGLGSSNA
jgi:type VI secretion system protein ImpF